MKKATIQDLYKLNVLELAKHHRATCQGETCVVSLFILRQMAEEMGVTFSQEEQEVFV